MQPTITIQTTETGTKVTVSGELTVKNAFYIHTRFQSIEPAHVEVVIDSESVDLSFVQLLWSLHERISKAGLTLQGEWRVSAQDKELLRKCGFDNMNINIPIL
jgi:anti-anti-sigma regulatory factor